MSETKIYKGDIGTQILLNAGEDISAATSIVIKYRKPSGDTGTWTATLSGTNYGLYYTQINDLDETGDWGVQLYIEVSGWKGCGDILYFRVHDRIIETTQTTRPMAKYVNWLRTEFKPLTLATPQEAIEQIVENAIRYWNTHSAYKIVEMAAYTPGTTRVQLSTEVKQVTEVIPNLATTWIYNDHPMWSLLGVTILDNLTSDLILMAEAFKNYKSYIGSDMRWEWVKSEDPDNEGGYLYVQNLPPGVTKVACIGTKRITKNEDIKIEYVLDFVLNYSLALLKQIEGNTLRKVQGVVPSIHSDGGDLISEGKEEQKELKEQLKKDGRWLAFAARG